MARVGRLAGGLLLETQLAGKSAWFLAGDTKTPCDFRAAGFVAPAERDVIRERFVQLVVQGSPTLTGTTLSIALDGVEAARAIGAAAHRRSQWLGERAPVEPDCRRGRSRTAERANDRLRMAV